jgi:hypothetical protein
MGKRKIQIVKRIREIYEFEVDEDLDYAEQNKIKQTAAEVVRKGLWYYNRALDDSSSAKVKLLDRKESDLVYPIAAENDDILATQNYAQNLLIMDEFLRIWSEYPREDWSATIHELARTIHEDGDESVWELYLPDDYYEKYFTNIAEEGEIAEWEPIDELWSERWDAEYEAIYLAIANMSNEEMLTWMKRLCEFIGY